MTCGVCLSPYAPRSCIPHGQSRYLHPEEGRGDVKPHEPDSPNCRDCGVAPGGYHHASCCLAVCLTCKGQRLLCPHDDDPLDDDDDPPPRGVGSASSDGPLPDLRVSSAFMPSCFANACQRRGGKP